MFFTPEPTPYSNYVVAVRDPLTLISIAAMNGDKPAILDIAAVVDFMQSWKVRQADGYDGQIALTEDPRCETKPGIYCKEIVIFSKALRKLGDIRALNVADTAA